MEAGTQNASLIPHPQTAAGCVDRIDASVARSAGALAFGYRIFGELSRIRIPQPRSARRAEELWRHTCFEAFVSNGDRGYYEFNFSPSGEWAVYSFRGYRDRAPLVDVAATKIDLRHNASAFEVDARVAVPTLALDRAPQLKIGLAAVIEEKDGVLHYWALRHPPGKPDFHHGDNFMLELSSANGTER
jgi:hypothetical protein